MPDSERRPFSSLRTLLIVPFILQIFLTAGFVGLLYIWNGRRAVEDIADQLNNEVSNRVQQRVQLYLKTPHFVNQLNAGSVELEQLDLNDTDAIERYFCKQLEAFQAIAQDPNPVTSGLNQSVNNIYFGNAKGELFGAELAQVTGREKRKIKVLRSDKSTEYRLQRFIVNNCTVTVQEEKSTTDDGNGTEENSATKGSKYDVKEEPYDPQERPWYKAAIAEGESTWSKVYRDATTKKLVIGAAYPVYDLKEGESKKDPTGVLGSDLLLDEVGDFLEKIRTGNSIIFILNRKEELIVDSTGETVDVDKFNQTESKIKTIKKKLTNESTKSEAEIKELKDTFINLKSENESRKSLKLFSKTLRQTSKEKSKIEFKEVKSDSINNPIEFGKVTKSGKPKVRAIAKCLGQGLVACPYEGEIYWIKETNLDLGDEYALDWEKIVVAIPESDFMARINENNKITIALWAASLALAIALGLYTARKISQPIYALQKNANKVTKSLKKRQSANKQISNKLTENTEQIQENIETIQRPYELKSLATDFSKMSVALNKAIENLEKTNNAYSRFVPREFLELLKKKIIAIRLGESTNLEMSVLFSDIRDFTRLSERMSTKDNFEFINKYLQTMEPAIGENNGFIDKYIGDAIMALFGGSADDAVQAGIDMLSKGLVKFNQERGQSGKREIIRIGIGIHTGRLMLGTVGSDRRMDGTVIGDSVNLASRLEGLTKYYGVQLLISGETQRKLKKTYEQRCLGRVKVKGREQAIEIFEIYSGKPLEEIDKINQISDRFESALKLYCRETIGQAQKIFQNILEADRKSHFQDGAAKFYYDRCQYYQQHGVPEEWNEEKWDGVEIFDEK